VDFLAVRLQNTPAPLISRANERYTPRDVITTISNGFGATTQITYAPLTNKEVYRRSNTSRNTLTWGRGAPVQDLLAPLYVVARASGSAPQAGNPEALASVHYRYADARVQAGGRGWLGFAEIVSFDPNQGNGTIATSTRYAQAFPFTGLPEETMRRVVANQTYTVPACLTGTLTDACFGAPGQAFPALGGALLSLNTQVWEADTDIGAAVRAFAPGEQRPVHVYTAGSEERVVDPFGGSETSRINTTFSYGAYGNVTQTAVDTRQGQTLLSSVTTTNTYAQDNPARWRLGRLTQSLVTHQRPGMDSIQRTAQFVYAMDGPATGLLTQERSGAGLGAEQELLTVYSYDGYGNRTHAVTCAHPATPAACASSLAQFQPGDARTLQRVSRQVFDAAGRYPVETWEPFRTATGHAEIKTHSVLARDLFGQPTHSVDHTGVDVWAVYGGLGRAYAAWVETVPGSTPDSPEGGIHTQTTWRWCGGGGNQVPCPTGARFRQQVKTTAAPTRWTYFDVHARPVLGVSESANVGISNRDASAVCTRYDAAGRVIGASVPFFLPGTVTGSGPPVAAGTCSAASVAWAVTHYDLIGRPILSQQPRDDGGVDTISTAYSGTTTTLTDPRGNPSSQQHNALGELVQTTDALGTQTHYLYRADGLTAHVERTVGRGLIRNSFTYDVMGRTLQHNDPDRGITHFSYNALGERLAQTDAAGNRSEQWYDARGRVWKQRTRTAAGATESESLYIWDTAANGRGQLASETRTGTYTAWIGQSGTALNFARNYSYDSLGRLAASTTVIDGTSYPQSIHYDSAGRAWNTQDASGRWASTQYTTRGQPVALCESSQSAVPAPCPANASTYLRILDTDAWGHTIKERRGNSAAMDVTRSTGARSGRLHTLCAGQSGTCALVNESYVWDAAGNMNLRVKDNRYQETFTYDALNRLTQATVTVHNGVTSNLTTVQTTYDRLGNICTSLTGDYTYQGRSGCGIDTTHGGGTTGTLGPHRVTQVAHNGAITHYSYDNRGNQTGRDAPGTANDRTIHYSLDDHAYAIQQGGTSTRFWYAPDGQRYKREDGGQRTLYLGNVEIETNAGISTIKRTLGGVLLQTIVGTTATNHYLFHDVLGSLVRITNASGSVIDLLDYHPFGARRTPSDPTAIQTTSPALTPRGFTGHEHLGTAALSLIHMNGRIFDPTIGRFLQTDPLVQAPHNLQSWNPYTYVFNNPLTYTDPTGLFSWKKWLRPIAAMVVSVATYGAAVGWLLKTALAGNAVAIGAIAGGIAGFAGGAVASGTWRSAVQGAFSGMVFGGIAGHFGGGFSWGNVAASGAAGGIMADLQGGTFGHGFLSAGVMASTAPGLNKIGNGTARTTAAAIAGGTISKLTGGKFANGAVTLAAQVTISTLVRGISGGEGEWVYPESDPLCRNCRYVITNGMLVNRDEFTRLVNITNSLGYFNPSGGFFADLMESFRQKFYGWAGDPLAAGLASGLARFDRPMIVIAHSQGTLTVVNALRWYGLSATHLTFDMRSPALSHYSALRAIQGAGGTMIWRQAWGDIANIYSPTLNPIKWLSGFGDVLCGMCQHKANGLSGGQ